MPGAQGRSRGRSRKNHAAPATTTHINSFARVSKQATVEGKGLGDHKAEAHDITSVTPSARKRKAARSPEPEETTNTPSQRKIVSASSKSTKKARLLGTENPTQAPVEQPSPSTPRPKSTKKRALSPAPEESPRTKEAGNLFKRLRLDVSPFPRATRAASPLIAPAAVTRSSTPAGSVVPDDSDENDADVDADAGSSSLTTPEPEQVPLPLPQELLDLVALYAAFLKTIAVHYAHNGTNTPVDLRDISQAVSLAWGKRRISLADVRRCVGVMDVPASPAPSPFYLVDYGAKRVCIELRRDRDEQQRGGPLDEDRLVRVFEKNLRGLWEAVGDLVAPDDLRAFVLSLPKAPVPSCESAAKASPLLTRGQRAMQALRDGMAAKKDEKEAAAAAAATAKMPSGDAPPPKLSLLDRLRLKETRLAALAGSAPTPEQLARVAALERAADVAAVVAMLAKSSSSGAGGRVSFTMAVVLQRLRDSLRLPVSREEGATCVRVLAAEVAPEWLRIVTVGARENVVVTVAQAPSAGALGERVGRLLGA